MGNEIHSLAPITPAFIVNIFAVPKRKSDECYILGTLTQHQSFNEQFL